MNDDFFGKRVERKPADPVYDKDGWRPHPEKPGWHIDRQGRLRGPGNNGGSASAPATAAPEAYKPTLPF